MLARKQIFFVDLWIFRFFLNVTCWIVLFPIPQKNAFIYEEILHYLAEFWFLNSSVKSYLLSTNCIKTIKIKCINWKTSVFSMLFAISLVTWHVKYSMRKQLIILKKIRAQGSDTTLSRVGSRSVKVELKRTFSMWIKNSPDVQNTDCSSSTSQMSKRELRSLNFAFKMVKIVSISCTLPEFSFTLNINQS